MNKSGGLLIKNKGRVDVEFGPTGPATPPLFSHVRLASTACVKTTSAFSVGSHSTFWKV